MQRPSIMSNMVFNKTLLTFGSETLTLTLQVLVQNYKFVVELYIHFDATEIMTKITRFVWYFFHALH